MISVRCPKCSEPFEAPDSLAGQTESCPACSNVCVIPAPAPAVPAPQPARPLSNVKCPSCHQSFNVRGPLAGHKATCPNCGRVFDLASPKTAPIWATALFVFIILGLGGWGLHSYFSLPDTPSARPPASPAAGRSHSDDKKRDAWLMAEQFVKDRLRSPSTAEFRGKGLFGESQDYRQCVRDLGGNRYRVAGWVDAQNAFGATLRSRFTCTLRSTGGDRWTCEAINIAARGGGG